MQFGIDVRQTLSLSPGFDKLKLVGHLKGELNVSDWR